MGWYSTVHSREVSDQEQQQQQQQPSPALRIHQPSEDPSIRASLSHDNVSQSSLPKTTSRRSSITTAQEVTSLQLARQTSLTCRLLALPSELRSQIYTSYFLSDGIPRIKPDYTLPGLLKTYRQIYYEAIGIYYSSPPAFRCLDEDSAVSWLCNLPPKYLDLIPEVRYDTRWIVFFTPYIPVAGVEYWLCGSLIKRLQQRGFEMKVLLGSGRRDGTVMGNAEGVAGKLRLSCYKGGAESRIVWVDQSGLIEIVGVRAT